MNGPFRLTDLAAGKPSSFPAASFVFQVVAHAGCHAVVKSVDRKPARPRSNRSGRWALKRERVQERAVPCLVIPIILSWFFNLAAWASHVRLLWPRATC